MRKRLTTALTTAFLLLITTACGSSSGMPSKQPSATTEESTSSAPEAATLRDGLSGSCNGSTLIANNKLSHVDLRTEGGNLFISIPKATDLMLADIGYYVNIYSAESNWTQVRMEYFKDTGEKNVYVTKLYGDGKTNNIGTFDVDSSNQNRLEVSVPSSLIAGDTGITWNAALDMNGKDIAFCPANQQDKASLS